MEYLYFVWTKFGVKRIVDVGFQFGYADSDILGRSLCDIYLISYNSVISINFNILRRIIDST